MAEKKMTVKVRLPKIKADQEDVFVSVNDYTCIVKRGVEATIQSVSRLAFKGMKETDKEIISIMLGK